MMYLTYILLLTSLGCLLSPAHAQTAPPAQTSASAKATALPYFRISVRDDETGRGIPCVCLRTLDRAEYWTDSAGEIAFYERELMGRKVYFDVASYGYSSPTNGFGFTGIQLLAQPSGQAVLKLQRENIAQRIYRCTGQGIYRDSELLGLPTPPIHEEGKEPIMGQDGGLMIPFKGKYIWSWGDTIRPDFPLGVFRSVGATSEFPANGGLDPDVGVRYHYFRDNEGRARPMVNLKVDLVWPLTPRVALDKEGKEHLLMNYCHGFEPTGGIIEFDEQTACFEQAGSLPPGPTTLYLSTVVTKYRQDGREYFGFGPWGAVRSATDLASGTNSSTWEFFTCLKEGASPTNGPSAFDRDEQGRLRWSWKRNARVIEDTELLQLVREGKLRAEERWYRALDANTGAESALHDGMVCWNAYRHRWICVRMQYAGASLLGEVLYFEGDTPLGPWVYCQKVVTHARGTNDSYSFYGAKLQRQFEAEGGRIVYFEGAFSQAFGSRPVPIPRYDYNEMIYKMDLADPRLFLPVPVYALRDAPSDLRTRHDLDDADRIASVVCFAPDRPRKGTVPVFAVVSQAGLTSLSTKRPDGSNARVAFYALPAEETGATTTVPLFAYRRAGSSELLYSTEPSLATKGYDKSPEPVCRVWPNPILFNPFELSTRWEDAPLSQ